MNFFSITQRRPFFSFPWASIILTAALALPMVTVPVGCGGSNSSDNPGGDEGDGVEMPGDADAEWTFMVYLNGDNELGASEQGYDGASDDLSEMTSGMMAAGAASDKVNVIVLYDQSTLSADSSTRLYRITRKGRTKLASDGTIFTGKEADMSLPNTLKKFGAWAVRKYPAKKYALILWDHGGGWRGGNNCADENAPDNMSRRCGRAFRTLGTKKPKAAFREFSYDDTDGVDADGYYSSISLADGAYGRALAGITSTIGGKLNLLGFDACLMGMYETAAASAPYADYLVASAESEPGTGWAYDGFMKALGNTPTMDARTLATRIVNDYADQVYYYMGRKLRFSATLAACDLSAMENLTAKLDAFGNEMKAAANDAASRNVIASLAGQVQRYSYQEHADLMHLAMLVSEKTNELPASLTASAGDLKTALSEATFHYRSQSELNYWGYTHENAYGMAVFFPESIDCAYYKQNPNYSFVYDSAEYNYGEDYIYSMKECVYYPEEPDGDVAWYSLGELKNYRKAGWSRGWSEFLEEYYGQNRSER